MGRTRLFDEADVTGRAMHAFRRAGYAALSIKDLEKATGLSSGSIYHSFGGKEAVFRRSLAHYNDAVVKRRIADHLGGPDPRAGLKNLFTSLLHEPGGGHDGCLLTNAAIEFGADKSVVGEALETGFRLLEDAFAREVHRATGAGDTAPIGARSRQTALRLLAFYQGVLVLFRSGRDAAGLLSAIETEIETCLGVADHD